MSHDTHTLQAQRDLSTTASFVVGPGFPPPPDGAVIPPVCKARRHSFTKRGICQRCRRTVPQLAVLGLASPVHCKRSGIHVAIGNRCIECGETLPKVGK